MKTIELNIQEPYFSYILSGKKTVEGRLNKGKFFDARVGDVLRINGQAEFKVVTKNIYPTFREMIEKEGLQNVIPDKNTVDEGVEVYYGFYSVGDEKKYGVVGMRIKKI